MSSASPGPGPFAALRQFVRQRPPAERCDLCSVGLAPEHHHLLELATRRLLCSCDACAVLFSGQETVRFRRVPPLLQALPNFQLTDVQWESLRIPINLV